VDLELGDPRAVEDHGPEGRGDEEKERSLEAARAQPDSRIDEERSQPHDRQHRDVDAVRLELERQVSRQGVPLDRNEQNQEDESGQKRGPGKERPVGNHQDDCHRNQRSGFGNRRSG
jgi:hypothetical protein